MQVVCNTLRVPCLGEWIGQFQGDDDAGGREGKEGGIVNTKTGEEEVLLLSNHLGNLAVLNLFSEDIEPRFDLFVDHKCHSLTGSHT